MNFYRITTCDHVNDFSGEGAYLHGGRWNSKGTRILYTAESMALAMLEALAHVTMVNQKRAYCRAVLESAFPEGSEHLKVGEPVLLKSTSNRNSPVLAEYWFKHIDFDSLPEDFRSNPGPDALRTFGDQFIEEGKYLALKVPSVIVQDSFNYLLNPSHTLFKHIRILESGSVSFDQRLVR